MNYSLIMKILRDTYKEFVMHGSFHPLGRCLRGTNDAIAELELVCRGQLCSGEALPESGKNILAARDPRDVQGKGIKARSSLSVVEKCSCKSFWRWPEEIPPAPLSTLTKSMLSLTFLREQRGNR